MKKLIPVVLLSALTMSSGAWAYKPEKNQQPHHYQYEQQYARVLSAEPIYETVRYTEPERECYQRDVPVRRQSNAAVVVGSIIGGAIGHELGHHKSNKQVGAVVGAVLGGAIASDIQRNRETVTYRTENVCHVSEQTYYREVITGYNVTYKYHGRIYHTVTEEDPGKRIPIEVNVRPARF